jgi:hypothetical protein
MGFRMSEGVVYEFSPGDVMDIPPGHDAWVIGDEAVILLDISGTSPTSVSRRLRPRRWQPS